MIGLERSVTTSKSGRHTRGYDGEGAVRVRARRKWSFSKTSRWNREGREKRFLFPEEDFFSGGSINVEAILIPNVLLAIKPKKKCVTGFEASFRYPVMAVYPILYLLQEEKLETGEKGFLRSPF